MAFQRLRPTSRNKEKVEATPWGRFAALLQSQANPQGLDRFQPGPSAVCAGVPFLVVVEQVPAQMTRLKLPLRNSSFN